MTKRLKSYLCGTWQDGEGEGQSLSDPMTGEALATASSAGLDLAAALDYAREKGGAALRKMSFEERAGLLTAMSESIHARRDELIELARQNGGNTRGDAKFDLDGATGTLAYYAKRGGKLGEKRFLIDGAQERLSRSPRFIGRHVLMPRHGVAVQINAYNFPAWGFGEKASCALLAGMPVLCKPATSTAMVAARIAEILVEDAVMPEGTFSFLMGSAGDLLDHLTEQDVVSFTGSAETGYRIRSNENLLRRSVRVGVEADSLNSAVLGADVKPESETWDLFLREVAHEMTQKSGQKCTAVRRIFVPKDRIDEVQEALIAELSSFRVGNPALREVRVGPLATASQKSDVQDGIRRLTEQVQLVHGEIGAKTLVDADGEKGAFQEPVLLRAEDATAATLVHELEVFGPVATLLPYDGTAGDAARLLALGLGSLVASAYSDDKDFARELFEAAAPWTGRLHFGSKKIAEHSTGSGAVLPLLIHGGPGRAGGGEELGGLRGLVFYSQRTALQGDDPMLAAMLENGAEI